MIDVKDAINNASSYLKNYFPGLKKVTIEEVELSDYRSLWRITISYTLEEGGLVAGYQIPRHYKTFIINAETGEVLSMKMK